MFTRTIEAVAECPENRALIWKLWSDPSLWPEWDSDIKWGRIDGPFENGTKGEMQPKDWLLIQFELIDVEKEKCFGTLSTFLFTRVEFRHFMVSCGEGRMKLIHRGVLTGFLAPVLYLLFGSKMKKALEEAVNHLAETLSKTNDPKRKNSY